MCGIAGVVGDIGPAAARDAVRAMVSALAHRGPDGEGIETWDGATLGHRRLAIFDLSDAGRQPMVSADRKLGVVFNGAIYNFRELRKLLTASGCRFRSNTDTEVLLHGYREWGIDELVARLDGMFAFGLWDNDHRRLYLVRDRLGVKPLVFTARNRHIAFASSIRALRAADQVGDVDEAAVADFLRHGFVPESVAIYRGCVKLPAATIAEWFDGTWNMRRFWRPRPAMMSAACSFDDAVEQTEQLLLSSVEARLHADVPVGALLSGGIDSGLVCWAASKLGADIAAYTIGTPGDPWDETANARETAQALGIRHCVLEMSQCDEPGIADLVNAYAEPFACASALGMLRVSRVVASSAKVLLTGDGGDDVFLGYPRHRHLWLAGMMSRVAPSALPLGWRMARPLLPRVGLLRRASALFDYASGDLRNFAGDVTLSAYTRAGLLGDRLANHLGQPLERLAVGSAAVPGDRHELLDRLLDHEYETAFVGEYLTKVDGATMHVGLEARSPFLDRALWEFASSLSFDVRLHRGRLKSVLRTLAHRKIGPFVARRRKRGFGVPVQRWITGRWRRRVETALTDSIAEANGWIRSAAARAVLRSSSAPGWAPEQLWYIFVLESWLRHEDDRVASARLGAVH